MIRLIPALIIGSLLLVPLGLLPFRSDEVSAFILSMEKRESHAFPNFQYISEITKQIRYTELGNFLSDRYPLRDLLVPNLAKFNYEVLRKPHLNGVDRGRNDPWLFLHDSLAFGYQDPEIALVTMDELQESLDAFAASQTEDLAKIILAIAPDKASIYTEELSDYSLREYEQFRPARLRFREIISQTEAVEAIDTWSAYQEMKLESKDRIYFYHDTHHTRAAALSLAKAIVNEVADSEIWTNAAYTVQDRMRKRAKSDLTTKAGLLGIVEEVHRVSAPVRLAELESATLDDGREIDPNQRSQWAEFARDTVRSIAISQGDVLVEGRVLLIHDSFLAGVRPDLAPYFRDITFTRSNSFEACSLGDILNEYDYVVLELVERSAARRGRLQKYVTNCVVPEPASLDQESIENAQVKGVANRCDDRADSSSKISGWVLVGKPAQKG